MTPDLIIDIISLAAIIAFPAMAMKIKAANAISKDVVEFVKRDPKENRAIFTEAKEAGLKNLADHINKKIDPHIDFYKG